MAGEYQFSLIDVTKQAGTKTILQDVNLSFFYGAHIGVIGGNGAGKSTLLKIRSSTTPRPSPRSSQKVSPTRRRWWSATRISAANLMTLRPPPRWSAFRR